MSYHDEDFCRRCGRPYEEHESDGIIDIDCAEASEYIFDRLLEDGVVSKREDIADVLHLFLEFLAFKQALRGD